MVPDFSAVKIHVRINKENVVVKSTFWSGNPCPDPETKYPDKQGHLRRINSAPSKTCPDTKNPDNWGPDNQGLTVVYRGCRTAGFYLCDELPL